MNVDFLLAMGACDDAIAWASQQKSCAQAWKDCQRGDWMLWYCGAMSGEPGGKGRKRLVLCACECARLALPHVPDGEERPRKAIETAEAWARGEADIDAVMVAARAASARAAYGASAAAASADAAAAYSAAAAAARAAAAAAARAADAAYSAAAAADAAAREKPLAACANIVRKHYPKMPKEKK